MVFLAMQKSDQDGPARRIAARVIRDLSEPYDVIRANDGGDQKAPDMTSIAASAGLACFPRDGETLEEIMKHADDCLYRAKDGGKRRVIVHGQTAVIRAETAD